MNENRKTLEENTIDIAVHEERLNQHNKILEKIANNDLPHIYRKIDSINLKIAYGGGIGFAIMFALEIYSNLP
mgnify:CR=1 FL=1